jgi:hypothetical protein
MAHLVIITCGVFIEKHKITEELLGKLDMTVIGIIIVFLEIFYEHCNSRGAEATAPFMNMLIGLKKQVRTL